MNWNVNVHLLFSRWNLAWSWKLVCGVKRLMTYYWFERKIDGQWYSFNTKVLPFTNQILCIHICDVIQGNESHVGKIQFFNTAYLCIKNTTFGSDSTFVLQLDTWLQSYGQIYNFLNNVRLKNLSPFRFITQSILETSDCFPFDLVTF